MNEGDTPFAGFMEVANTEEETEEGWVAAVSNYVPETATITAGASLLGGGISQAVRLVDNIRSLGQTQTGQDWLAMSEGRLPDSMLPQIPTFRGTKRPRLTQSGGGWGPPPQCPSCFWCRGANSFPRPSSHWTRSNGLLLSQGNGLCT